MRRSLLLVLLCVAVLVTRLPFLGEGYGLHADNWRIALAARHIAETGVYEASRFPGYPVQEYVCSMFWKTGPFGLNLLDAVFCTAAALFFALVCIEYGVADWWFAALALAFVPIIYVNSVSSKDFPWALAFLLASWFFALRKKPVLTGLMLGIAMGCRMTSGAAALPIALVLVDQADNRVALRRILITAVVSAIVVLAAYTPVYIRYGFSFFDFYADHAMPGALMITSRMTIEVWGLLGVVGVCLALVAGAFCTGQRPAAAQRQLFAWGAMLVIYVIIFFCLPDEAAYLIPAVPFILLLLWRISPRWAFQACCALVILSPFVAMRGPRPAVGLIIQDHRARVATDNQINGFLHFAAQVSGSNAYIAGGWEPPIEVLTADNAVPNEKFAYLLTAPELDQLVAHGWHVWYLPLMREFNFRVYHYDVAQHGARDVRLLHP